MKINILTIFPDMFRPLRESMLGRAEEKGIIEFNIVDVRDFSADKHRNTDDYPFGGGQGMVFMPQPAFDALKSVGAENTRNIYMSPRGKVLDMELALELAEYLKGSACAQDECCKEKTIKKFTKEAVLTIFCGHYEGIDQRIIDAWNMEEVSIGDYILTGGELAAMVLIDTVARLIPGVLGEENSAMDESIYSGLLEYPQYTQPRSFNVAMGGTAGTISADGTADEKAFTQTLDVPDVLLSGNHKEIGIWRFRESVRITKKSRYDILKAFLKNHGPLERAEIEVLMDELNKRELETLKKSFSENEAKAFAKILEKRRKKVAIGKK